MKLTVEKSTKSSNGGFVNTLVGETLIKVFGVPKTVKHRFLMKTDEEVPAGTTDNINLNDFNQVPQQSEMEDGKIINVTWLHLKATERAA